MALRYGFGLPRFFLKPLSLEECYALVRRRVEEREENFLAQLRRSVYPNPQSPYARLLRWAGCEYEDAERMVRQKGLEKTLKKLSDAGVYITIREYKGKTPIERAGLSFQAQPEDFDNPLVVPSLEGRSSGTRGSPVRTKIDFDFLTERAAEDAVLFDALGLYEKPYAFWKATSRNVLCAAKAGIPLVKWFLPLSSNRNKLALYYAIVMGRLLGYGLPWPQPIRSDQAYKVAEWLEEKSRAVPVIALKTFPSSAVRVCAAARERGLDISATHFITSGEPLTPSREELIKATGCKVVSLYDSSETGTIGAGCINSTGDDVHLLKGHIAVIQQNRLVGYTEATVHALQVTAFLPSAPKVLINMENGDYARLESRRCGCKLDELGLTDHLSHIRSYEKLTSEGMTFFAGDLVRVLEEVLPSRFGGGPLDYQAIEEEGKDGLSHLNLIVSPKVGKIEEKMLVRTVLEELTKNGGSGRMMARVWKEAGTVRVRREDPRPTKGGKVFSFQVETVSSQEN